MSIKNRLKNAYQAGGIGEILRKTFYHYVYRFHNYATKRKVLKSSLEYGLCTDSQRDFQVVVSLTSYPARFHVLPLCLKSLLLQKEKPNKIIVYLGSDTKESDFTNEMLSLKQYGIEYRIDSTQNLRSYKKFYYSMQEYPNAVIVKK